MALPSQPLALLAFAGPLLLLLVAAAALAGFLRVYWCYLRGPDLPLPEPAPPPAEGEEPAKESGKEKRRRRKARSKQQKGSPDGGNGVAAAGVSEAEGSRRPGFPLASVAGALQRRITAMYDELVRTSQVKALTIDQVSEFINCLVEARNDLLHKSYQVQRSFKIKKALLFKTDRSSFDRLCQEVQRLEAAHKRLEKDAAIYHLLQEQLKISPAYQMLLEITARIEEDLASEDQEISFEELLALEKEDSFWRPNGKLRLISK